MLGLTARGYAALGLAALLFAAGAAADRAAPLIGATAQIRAARADRDAWRRAQADTAVLAVAWARSFGLAEGRRRREQATAVEALNAAQAACDARVAAARKSALAIQSLVTKEVPRDPQGCPVRQLVDPGELRDALRPTAPAGG